MSNTNRILLSKFELIMCNYTLFSIINPENSSALQAVKNLRICNRLNLAYFQIRVI